mmetsp:Transcript_111527/g.359984  ORF Transcript_111527/g.359984 Transcript_111527/m.359984 type:complete len:215 (+) Transcript_111527:813-1457(+)
MPPGLAAAVGVLPGASEATDGKVAGGLRCAREAAVRPEASLITGLLPHHGDAVTRGYPHLGAVLGQPGLLHAEEPGGLRRLLHLRCLCLGVGGSSLVRRPLSPRQQDLLALLAGLALPVRALLGAFNELGERRRGRSIEHVLECSEPSGLQCHLTPEALQALPESCGPVLGQLQQQEGLQPVLRDAVARGGVPAASGSAGIRRLCGLRFQRRGP